MVLFCVVGLGAMTKVQRKLQRWKSLISIYTFSIVDTKSACFTQFMGGKYDAIDKRVKRRSERTVELEQAHKAIVSRLELSDYEIRPIPRPPTDK